MQKWGPMGHTQNKKQFFFQKQQNQILSFQNLFILTKYCVLAELSYECFSILCNAFLLKSTISSHNTAVVSHMHGCFEDFVIIYSLLFVVNFFITSYLASCFLFISDIDPYLPFREDLPFSKFPSRKIFYFWK